MHRKRAVTRLLLHQITQLLIGQLHGFYGVVQRADLFLQTIDNIRLFIIIKPDHRLPVFFKEINKFIQQRNIKLIKSNSKTFIILQKTYLF